MPTPFVHAVFRAHGHRDLLEHHHASWLWRALERSFPDALQVVLMPNHGHLLVPASPDIARRIGAILGRFTHRHRRGRSTWFPLRPPRSIDDVFKLRRQFRYVALNGCRARLTGDPLAWRWSTYRDVMGAIAAPWVDPASVADALGWPTRHLHRRLHAYVSGDPSCSVRGTPPPNDEIVGVPSLGVALDAAASALRSDSTRIDREPGLRRLFIQLATHLGWRDSRFVADVARCSPRHVQRVRSTAIAEGALRAALRCVAEERFRR